MICPGVRIGAKGKMNLYFVEYSSCCNLFSGDIFRSGRVKKSASCSKKINFVSYSDEVKYFVLKWWTHLNILNDKFNFFSKLLLVIVHHTTELVMIAFGIFHVIDRLMLDVSMVSKTFVAFATFLGPTIFTMDRITFRVCPMVRCIFGLRHKSIVHLMGEYI